MQPLTCWVWLLLKSLVGYTNDHTNGYISVSVCTVRRLRGQRMRIYDSGVSELKTAS